MSLSKTMRDVCIDLRDRSRKTFYPDREKRKIDQKEDELLGKIRDGQLGQDLLNNAGWINFFLPYLQKLKKGAEDDLRTHRLRHPSGKDEHNFYPTGILDAMIMVLNYPQEKITQAETARQELGLLQKMKGQDNVA
jgi:hypothetical protein